MSTFSVSSLTEKSSSLDKDIRHMAMWDLNNELQKDTLKLDENSQRQLAEIVLKLLDDTSSDVQGVAVKCLAPLVKKMSKQQVEVNISKLSENLALGKDEKRDISTIALKTVVSEIPIESAVGPVKKAIDNLVKALKTNNQEVKLDALDVLGDILNRFGTLVTSYHSDLQSSFTAELSAKRDPIRKRAITCLAELSVHTSDKLFEELIQLVINKIEANIAGGEELRTFIQLTSAISKVVGQRLGKHLNKIVPLLMEAAEKISESENDVREYIMQAFDSFVVRCPDQISKHLHLILILAKEYLEYDPNYSYDTSDDEAEEEEDQDEEMGSDGEGDDEDSIGDDEGGMSDDDDISWKVRRAAAKCIGSLIRSRPEMLTILYKELCSSEEYLLPQRFKEREEPVKLDVFQIFIDLLNQTVTHTTLSNGEVIVNQRAEIKYIKETKNIIMSRLKLMLKEKSHKTRLGAFQVLKVLTVTLKGGLENYVKAILPAVTHALVEKGEQIALKLEALSFLKVFLANHSTDVIKPHLSKLSQAVYQRVNDKYYKIIAESLRVCAELVRFIKSTKGSAEYSKYSQDLFKNVCDRLEVQDIDQDVKESAIQTAGLILANLGDQLSPEQSQKTLNLLLERLKNEITRLTAVRTWAVLAENKVNLEPTSTTSATDSFLYKVINELSNFLKKYNRPLRQATLNTLTTFVKNYSNKIDRTSYNQIINESSSLVVDSDLYLAHLSLQLESQIIESDPKLSQQVRDVVLPKLLKLLESSTLQGNALDSGLKLLSMLVSTTDFDKLLKQVLDVKKESKQVYTNIGKAVATLCATKSTSDNHRKSTIDRFASDLQSKEVETKMLALFTLGEIGRTIDLSSNANVRRDIEACFEDEGGEELKNAASYALGNISVGNLKDFLPKIIQGIRENPKRKYLLIHSLKEIISEAKPEQMTPFIQHTVPLLFENCDNEEEGVRNVVSECLGKLSLVDYDQVMPQLQALLTQSELKRSTAISAVKYTITEQQRDTDVKLKKDLPSFLKLLDKSQSVTVRRAAVLLLNSAAHNKPSLIVDRLDTILPHLYQETVFDESLVRVVSLGPFKHRTDDGLELRKSAFECLDSMLDQFKSRIDPNKFIAQLPNGLGDENDDIKMLTHLITGKAAQAYPASLLSSVDLLIPPLTKTLKKKEKESAVAQEKEREAEVLRSAMKAVNALKQLNGVEENSAAFVDMYQKVIINDAKLKAVFDEVTSNTEDGLQG
ncbi:cullin-associated NEDD8-dissociated protein [Acrasis kona]|uniref:Cullin-associated NEDD8-dissociated protein n=1 Tax=Acrasis kona TaxID=1008807 RepID=A0AAW2Z8Z2_9EUKA